MMTREAETGRELSVSDFLQRAYRRSGRGRTSFIWSWSWHIFRWKIQPVVQEHRLTLALHAQTRIKYLTGCLYRVSSHALTSYINTAVFFFPFFFLLAVLYWPPQKQQFSRLCRNASLQNNYSSIFRATAIRKRHRYDSCGAPLCAAQSFGCIGPSAFLWSVWYQLPFESVSTYQLPFESTAAPGGALQELRQGRATEFFLFLAL